MSEANATSETNTTNVFGHFLAPHGLNPILQAMQKNVGPNQATIEPTGKNGAECLHITNENMKFDSNPLKANKHLFEGRVAGSVDQICLVVQDLSQEFALIGIEHSFEIYNDQDELVQEIPVRVS